MSLAIVEGTPLPQSVSAVLDPAPAQKDYVITGCPPPTAVVPWMSRPD
jgi:hypothetical protein